MNDTNGATDRFLTLAMFKGQLEEIHNSIERDIISRVVDDKKDKIEKLGPGATKEVTVKLHITNAGVDVTDGSRLVVEELTRLSTFYRSVQQTIDFMRDSILVLDQVDRPILPQPK